MIAGFEELQSLLERVRHEIHKVIIGQDDAIRQTLIVILAGQHAPIDHHAAFAGDHVGHRSAGNPSNRDRGSAEERVAPLTTMPDPLPSSSYVPNIAGLSAQP